MLGPHPDGMNNAITLARDTCFRMKLFAVQGQGK